jgi:hypothetical protein
MTNKNEIIAEKDGSFTVNVNTGSVNASPPHIVDSGASVINNEPVAWIAIGDNTSVFFDLDCALAIDDNPTPLYTHPAKTLTDEDIAKVVHELNQKARTPDRWVTAMEIGAETIIQLRDELAILRKAQKK